MSHAHHHGGGGAPLATPDAARIALVGSPNAGKTTLFNGLTGLRAKTGNYPGVTVARYEGRYDTPAGPVIVEDLPGTYSLDPISPDAEVVAKVLDEAGQLAGVVAVVDATNLRRGLGLVAQIQHAGLPTVVVLTFVEGTNSSADDLRTLRLESVKKGVGMMVSGAREAGAPVAVLPLGLAYHGREHAKLPPRRAVAAAGPIVVWDSGPPPTVDEVRAAVRDGIDEALTAAWR